MIRENSDTTNTEIKRKNGPEHYQQKIKLWSFDGVLGPVLFVSILLIFLSAFRPLALPDEARYAEIGRWMWESGDWLVPRLNGIPFFHKPPLLYWLGGIANSVTGPSAWFFRLIPVTHAILILALMGPFLCETLGVIFARKAVLIFGSSAAFLLGGQYINHDMMVACWINIAIGSFGWFVMHCDPNSSASIEDKAITNKRVPLLGFFACGMGVLSKGLIGVVLPLAVVLAWLCWCGRWYALKRLPWVSGLLVFICITFPWFIVVESKYPGMLSYMFGMHQLARFTGTQFNNPQPFWFYLVAISLLMGPWFLGFWVHQYQNLYDILRNSSGFKERLKSFLNEFKWEKQNQIKSEKLLIGLCVIWVWVIVIFFSIPSSKIIGYVLPVIAPTCVLCVLGWDRLTQQTRIKHFFYKGMFVLSLGVVVLIQIQAAVITNRYASVDVAKVLSCQDLSNAKILIAGEYAYDLPFLMNLKTQLWVVQNWDNERIHAGDNWRREMFEGVNFEPETSSVLKPMYTLATESKVSERWLLIPKEWTAKPMVENFGYILEYKGQAWSLYRSQLTHSIKFDVTGSCPKQ